MVYEIALYLSLALCGFGLVYKIAGWFRYSVGIQNPDLTAGVRLLLALKGIVDVLFSAKLFTLVRVFVTDVLFQNHIRRQDLSRWVMHLLMFGGFAFLFFMHALDKIIITTLFDRYYLALNPFLLVSGGLVLAGVAIAACRRFIWKVPRLKTHPMDLYLLILLSVILLSGMVLEFTKLTSYAHYQKIWDIHLIACLAGLALVPFSKMFHLVATPISVLANAVMDENSHPANIKTRQVMELDACVHCGNCSRRCSVAVAFDSLGNENILPSERMSFLKRYISHKNVGAKGLAAIQQGVCLCTNCDRCTVICPAGINLRELWFNVREEMIQKGDSCVPLMLTPFSYYRALRRRDMDGGQYELPLQKAQHAVTAPFERLARTDAVLRLTPGNGDFKKSVGLAGRNGTYAFCFSCENCSTVCPVVGAHEEPKQALDLLPHQIIRSLGMGLKELAMGSRMLWYCLTCYQCQEHCPQGVKVTDIFYELKNLAVKEANCPPAQNGPVERACR